MSLACKAGGSGIFVISTATFYQLGFNRVLNSFKPMRTLNSSSQKSETKNLKEFL